MFWLSDDITVTRNDDVEINTMKGYLGKVFELIFNLGMAKCFLFLDWKWPDLKREL